VIGTEGRIENFGDGIADDSCVCLWNRRSDRYASKANKTFHLDQRTGGHGGGDPSIVAEFLRYVREGGSIKTSPIAARYSVAAGCMATESLRNGSMPKAVPPLDGELHDYFEAKRGHPSHTGAPANNTTPDYV
jgi:hypothetical protein